MSESKAKFVYPRLQLAYLLQFAIWGSWSIALGGYLNGKLEAVKIIGDWTGGIGLIYNAYPIGVILAAMFIGPIADRFLAAQKMLGILQLIGGVALCAAGYICATAVAAGNMIPFWPLFLLMLLSGICYLPTIPLINAVVFKHIPDTSKATWVFIFGTLGWILVNLFIEIGCGGATNPMFFYVGGALALFYGFYAFSLPDTPPKGAPAEGAKSDALGLGALAMFKNYKFTIFVLCAFMVSLFGSNFYFPKLVTYLSEHGYPAPMALGTLNQFSELFFMALLGFCVARFGLKWVLVLGMGAWALRYFIFTLDGFSFALIGLLLHGMAYAYLYTAAYMFGDKVAPAHLKASVQSLLAFLLLGVGQLMSGVFVDFQEGKSLPEKVPTVVNGKADAEKPVTAFLPWSEKSNLQYLELAKSLQFAMGEKRAFDTIDLADYATDGKLTVADLTMDKLKGNSEVTDEERAKAKEGEILIGSFPNISPVKIADAKVQLESVMAKTGTKELSRADWLKVQRHDWKTFFMMPSCFCLFWLVVFLLFGREPDAAAEVKAAVEVKVENADTVVA
ncbi:MAG: MFS transporter [Planctomycetia bacterium]|nr:MFS transporter [Planctomycetia bacterium]